MSIVWSQFDELYKKGLIQKTDIIKLLRNAEFSLINNTSQIGANENLSDEERVKKKEKKWGEFLASLQLILISPSNLRIKLADKIFNLEDTEYRTIESNKDSSSLKNKTASILRTVPIYRYMADFYKIDRVRFEQAVKKSQVLDTIESPNPQSPTSI